MANHLDDLLRDWPYEPDTVSVRLVECADGRDVIQMRIEMGILQLEATGRPDGIRPQGRATYLEYLHDLEADEGDAFPLDDEQCQECDREFVQFYHRRVCWLALQEYERAIKDADHTLALMDMCSRHSPSEEWTLSHEQYRPFVLYHRIQADAMANLLNEDAEAAIQAINRGLDDIRRFFTTHEIEDRFDDDDLVRRLIELRESLREQFDVGKTLQEQLAEAIADEQYELAARLRDELRNNDKKR
ncbi:MAG: UvrB/UvrC motif-containing protein [Pirellulaceae bacterium]